MRHHPTLLHGIGIGNGAAAGNVLRMPPPLAEPAADQTAADPTEEYARAARALAETAEQLAAAAAGGKEEVRAVLGAQALMAQDPSILEDVRTRTTAGRSAERAVFESFQAFQVMFESVGGVMAGRVADLRDVSARVIARLRGLEPPGIPDSDDPFILVADDLAPVDTATIDLSKVLAIVTREGGPTSHTAILARSMGLVAVVGVPGSDDLRSGSSVLVDASTGTVSVDPSGDDVGTALDRSSKPSTRGTSPGILADGTSVPLLANVGNPRDAEEALRLGAEGVGLFRTEFLFLDRTDAPRVEEQAARYRELFAAFTGRPVVVRVLDAGGDKPMEFLHPEHEDNPALGRRGIRALRANEGILRDQLAALASAQRDTSARLRVMAPMVADLEETRYFLRLGREYGLDSLGITVEVPSAALVIDQLVAELDFVSVGTNDLTQYTMAADRMLASAGHYQDPWHPAVLRLIQLIGSAGGRAGIPVGVCGEAAADPLLDVVLLGLGVTELSMAPIALADVRERLAGVALDTAREAARAALSATSAGQARALVDKLLANG